MKKCKLDTLRMPSGNILDDSGSEPTEELEENSDFDENL